MAATRTCPSCQAESTAADYCDTCGANLDPPESAARAGGSPSSDTLTLAGVSAPAGPGLVAAGFRCRNCDAARSPDDAFCEVCGLDFTTDEMPEAPPPAQPIQARQWAVVIAADRNFYEGNRAEAAEPLPFPDALAPREVPLTGTEMVVGRSDEARGAFPDIDLSRPVRDPCVSRRHAVLRRQPDGSWTLIDEGSANGTWLNDNPAPVTPGEPVVLHEGDRILLGAFTVLTLRNLGEPTES